jgi:hypothetical protein
MKTPLFNQSHPSVKLIFLISLMLVSISFLIAAGLFLDQNDTNDMKIMAAFQQIFLFIIPALLASFLYSGNTKKYLFFNTRPFSIFLLVLLIMIIAIPIINYLGLINSKLNIPESLSGLEQKLKAFEESRKNLTLRFLNVTTFQAYLLNILIIAALPAIGEEFIFRGVVLNLFKEWTKNIHVAVFVSAFIFSFIHFQFYGFLPRLMLGVLFGYLLVWSGSIWLPVMAHFINNAFAVSIFYFGNTQDAIQKVERFGTENPTILIFSAFILGFLLYAYYKTGKEKNLLQIND